MKTPVIFFKHYTRDTPLIIQQFWLEALRDGVKKFGINIKAPIGVDFINQGVIEIWENRTAIRQIKTGLIKFCKQEPEAALVLLAEYRRGLKILEPIWRRGSLNNLAAFKKYLEKVRELVLGDLFISFLGPDERLTGKIKDLAVKLRSQDHFFASNSKVMKATLARLFPKLKDYVNVLRLEDLDKVPTKVECQKRFKNFVWAPDGYAKIQKLEAYTKTKGYKLAKDVPKKISGGLAGLTASAGKAQGRAKLIFSVRDLDKVKQGDIIISPMTTADMLPAIKKAAAIVTDEGGLICHAAIVARELKKPCLIATRTATKFFKDGDLVEVDAEKKIVRLIKRKAK